MSHKADPHSRYLKGMTESLPKGSGALSGYIAELSNISPDLSDQALEITHNALTSDNGLKLLKLLENSILLSSPPNGVSDSALREMNAVRNFVLELRRLATNGPQRRK